MQTVVHVCTRLHTNDEFQLEIKLKRDQKSIRGAKGEWSEQSFGELVHG